MHFIFGGSFPYFNNQLVTSFRGRWDITVTIKTSTCGWCWICLIGSRWNMVETPSLEGALPGTLGIGRGNTGGLPDPRHEMKGALPCMDVHYRCWKARRLQQ
ncbi:hypothetical protein M5689_015862 [Euphorbia peplus]|nr:hypothetical protein M5689_015862 [Euphorbia peplus]